MSPPSDAFLRHGLVGVGAGPCACSPGRRNDGETSGAGTGTCPYKTPVLAARATLGGRSELDDALLPQVLDLFEEFGHLGRPAAAEVPAVLCLPAAWAGRP